MWLEFFHVKDETQETFLSLLQCVVANIYKEGSSVPDNTSAMHLTSLTSLPEVQIQFQET